MKTFLHKKPPRLLHAIAGAVKTEICFSLGQDPCNAGLMPQAEQGICQTDLMLLTHARCALKDPHGCFGISDDPAAMLSRTGQGREVKSMIVRCTEGSGCTGSLSVCTRTLHSFVLLPYAENASTEQLPFGLGAAAEDVRIRSGKKITCTGRPDESDARNGRLQPAGCARTGSLHARGRHESDGCNGSRLPAEPDTSRCPQPWRSG